MKSIIIHATSFYRMHSIKVTSTSFINIEVIHVTSLAVKHNDCTYASAAKSKNVIAFLWVLLLIVVWPFKLVIFVMHSTDCGFRSHHQPLTDPQCLNS